MDMENILANLVRIGTVSAVDAGKKKARVIFRDKNDLVSDWLPVLQHSGAGVTCGSSSGTLGYWMPAVNHTVLVIYLPVFNGDGFIMGAI